MEHSDKVDECDMEEDKIVVSKLALIAYAYPELKKKFKIYHDAIEMRQNPPPSVTSTTT